MSNSIDFHLEKIHEAEQALLTLRENHRQAIHLEVTGKEDFWELYSKIKGSCLTQEEFNDRMMRVRETWLDKKMKIF